MACQGVAKRIPPRLLSQQQQSLLFFFVVVADIVILRLSILNLLQNFCRIPRIESAPIGSLSCFF
jgi:hypothetical protein